jgi:hypothetical protein
MCFRNLQLIILIQLGLGLDAAITLAAPQSPPCGDRCTGSSKALLIAVRYRQQIRREIHVPPHQPSPLQGHSPARDSVAVRNADPGHTSLCSLSLASLATRCTHMQL